MSDDVALKPQVLPVGLADMAPGPELAAVLASVDVARLAPADVFVVLAAHHRLVAHFEARLLADLVEAGRLTYGVGEGPLSRKAGLDRFSADEAAFTLRWSVEVAQGQQFLAEHLMRRLPAVYELLVAGRIDMAKARAFHSSLLPVADECVAAILARTVAGAPRWTVENLYRRLRYWVLRLDPEAATRRHRASVVQRRVWARLEEDSTATLGGSRLPADRAAAAFDRVDAMARAARADGDPRTLNQLRADVYLDLLSGTVFARRPSRDPLTEDADTTHPTHDDDDQLPHRHSDVVACDDDRPGPNMVGGDDHDRLRGGRDMVAGDDHNGLRGDGDMVAGGDHDPPRGARDVVAGDDHEAADQTVRVPASRLVADVDWLSRVGFTDAAGRPFTATPHAWSDLNPPPGGSGGAWVGREWRPGPVPVPATVTIAAGVDPAWAAAFTAATVCSCGGLRPPPRGGVQVLTKLTTLMCLDDDPVWIPGWGPVIADIARQVAHDQQTRPPWLYHVTDARGNLLHHGHTRRRPTPTERAFVQARDGTCRAPGCTKPARHCDLDHRQPHATGGPSHRANLCTLCPHHHALRHEHGYTYHQISLGTYLAQSPSGQHWLITPDGHLILTADGIDPGPPPGYTSTILGHGDDEDGG